MSAPKRRNLLLVLLVSALAFCASAPASGYSVLHSKTRAELSATTTANRVEFVAASPTNAPSYYDPFGKIAFDSSVAPRSGTNTFDTIPEGRRLTTYYPPNRGFLGEPVTETLQSGARFDRYGFEGGKFAAPVRTPAPMRALSPGTLEKPYNVYEVVKPLDVRSGTTAPWFQQPGLGTQYELPASISELIEQGIIRRVN